MRTDRTVRTGCQAFLAHKAPQGQFQPFLDLLEVKDQRALLQLLQDLLEAKALQELQAQLQLLQDLLEAKVLQEPRVPSQTLTWGV